MVDDQYDNVGSAKLDRLLDERSRAVAEGHRALMFIRLTRYRARAFTGLGAAGIAYSYLGGEDPESGRGGRQSLRGVTWRLNLA